MAKKDVNTTVSFRLSEEDKEKLMQLAENEERSLSQFLRIIIQNYLKNQ